VAISSRGIFDSVASAHALLLDLFRKPDPLLACRLRLPGPSVVAASICRSPCRRYAGCTIKTDMLSGWGGAKTSLNK
jgi:hypothetical protein